MITDQVMAAPSRFGAVGLDLRWFGRILRLLLGTAVVVGIQVGRAIFGPALVPPFFEVRSEATL